MRPLFPKSISPVPGTRKRTEQQKRRPEFGQRPKTPRGAERGPEHSRAPVRPSEQPHPAAPLATEQVDVQAADPKLTRIELPPNGKPRAAILSESPEIPGRIVATVYLRMGLPKNWTLEYWGQSGAVGLDPPWPYSILRPDLTLPPEADALLVRGRLTVEGRLEQLALLAPAEWAQEDSLFRALGQWKFRPPTKDGQPVPVEVLLVVPRQADE